MLYKLCHFVYLQALSVSMRGFRVYVSLGGKQVSKILYICKCCFGFRVQELDSIVVIYFRFNVPSKS